MKAVHIPMIALVYVIKISMGSKVTIGNVTIDVGPANVVRLCGNNEEFQTNTDSSFSCPCVPNAYRNDMTHRCTLTYEWMEFTPNLVGDSRFVKTAKNTDEFFVVARAVYDNGDMIPREGIINIYTKAIKFSFEPDTAISDIEALMIKSGSAVWVTPSNDTIRKDAIQGGTLNRQPIYLCQTLIGQIHHMGWSRANSSVCNFNGAEHPNLALLVYQK